MQYQVKEADLATAWSNNVPVVATPVLVWLCEMASIEATKESGEDIFTVGYAHDCKHLASARLGDTLSACAKLVNRSEKRLTFETQVLLGDTILMSSVHTRAIVNPEIFGKR